MRRALSPHTEYSRTAYALSRKSPDALRKVKKPYGGVAYGFRP